MIQKLVAYVSMAGKTARLAEALADVMDADLVEIDSLSWRCEHLEEYEAVYLGFPILGNQVPGMISNLLDSDIFRGKTVFLFSPSAGCDMEQLRLRLQQRCPEARILDSMVLPADAPLETLSDWAEQTRQMLQS